MLQSAIKKQPQKRVVMIKQEQKLLVALTHRLKPQHPQKCTLVVKNQLLQVVKLVAQKVHTQKCQRRKNLILLNHYETIRSKQTTCKKSNLSRLLFFVHRSQNTVLIIR